MGPPSSRFENTVSKSGLGALTSKDSSCSPSAFAATSVSLPAPTGAWPLRVPRTATRENPGTTSFNISSRFVG